MGKGAKLLGERGGVLLGILGGGLLPGSPNPDPISDEKKSFFPPVFRPDLFKIMSSLLRYSNKKQGCH